MICPKCGGSGWHESPAYNPIVTQASTTTCCSTCGGLGWIADHATVTINSNGTMPCIPCIKKDAELDEQAALITRLTERLREKDAEVSGLTRDVLDREAEIARLTNIVDAVRMQAQRWAQEARTQQDTVCRIYEIVTGKTGEPGDWHGERPVADEIARLNAVIRAMAIEATARCGVDLCPADCSGKISSKRFTRTREECIARYIDHFTKQEAKDV